MKVIHQGSELEIRRKAFWVGVHVSCADCKHSVELEWTDNKAVDIKFNTKNKYVEVTVNCPVCKRNMVAVLHGDHFEELMAAASAITQEEFNAEIGKML